MKQQETKLTLLNSSYSGKLEVIHRKRIGKIQSWNDEKEDKDTEARKWSDVWVLVSPKEIPQHMKQKKVFTNMKEKEERTVSGNWKGTLGSGKKWYQALNPEMYFNEFAALQNKRKMS